MTQTLEPIVTLPVAVDANGEVIRLGDPVWWDYVGYVVTGMYRPGDDHRVLILEGYRGELEMKSEAVRRNPAISLRIYG